MLPSQNYMKPVLSIVALLAAFSGGTWAQTNFELPRECRERHGVDPEKCVIQDGPPADPWVRKKPQTAKPVPNPTPTPTPATPVNAPAGRIAR